MVFSHGGGRGLVVAQFLLDPPTHKKSETGNRLAVSADAGGERLRSLRPLNSRRDSRDSLTLTLTLAVNADA